MPHNEPGNEPEVTVLEAALEFFSVEAADRRPSPFLSTLLRVAPTRFLVSGMATRGGGAITANHPLDSGVVTSWYGSVEAATFWRDEMVSVEAGIAPTYPILHHSIFGDDDYDPQLGGAGRHTHDVADHSLWADVSAAAPAGSAIRSSPAMAVGNVAERIEVEPGGFPGTHVFLASRTTPEGFQFRPEGNSLVIKTADAADAGAVDATASALQTFLEDALATLQADFPDNHADYFGGITSVPIVEA